MKFFSVATLAIAFASSAWASPVASTDSVNDIVAALRARSSAAEFFHVGNDHVLRAISADYKVVGRAPLEERHVAEWSADMQEDMIKRSTESEADILARVAAQRREVDVDALLKRQAPGTCNAIACSGGCGPCTCRIGNLSSRCW